MWYEINDPNHPPPKDGTCVVMADWRVAGGHPVAVSWDVSERGFMWTDSESIIGYTNEFFTHWMPLPPAPAAAVAAVRAAIAAVLNKKEDE